MTRGIFIQIEGGDGAGKDTHIACIKELLQDRAVVFTREPGGTPLGKVLREMLLHNSHGEVSLPAEVFLFLGDRAQHVEEIIKPALSAGAIVISNRSWLSFIAYQVYGREQYDWKDLIELSIQKIYTGVPADLTIILDVPPDVGRARQRAMGKIPDTMERMAEESHNRIRKAYLDFAKTLPQSIVIDASRPLDEVWNDVKSEVLKVI